MSKRTRDKRRALRASAVEPASSTVSELQIMEQQLTPSLNLEDINGYALGTTNDIPGEYSSFPLTWENFRPDAWDGIPAYVTPTDNYVRATAINQEIGGQSGQKGFTYSTGPVSSDAVENFALDGRQQIIRRQPDTNYGPVSTSDHGALLAMAYAQQVNQFYPNEQSQYDLIKAI